MTAAQPKNDFDSLTRDVELLKSGLAANIALTQNIDKNTSEIIEFWKAAEGGIKVLGYLGRIAKWVGMVAATITAIYAAIYTLTHWGGPPPTSTKDLFK